MSSRLQMQIQNPVKHQQWSVYCKKITGFSSLLLFGINRVLNMPVDYLSCFVLVIRGIHMTINIFQTDYSVHLRLQIFPLF